MATASVIIPTYNRANVLPRAIDSVLNQTYDDFEIIVVDDGSTDNTEDVVASYSDDRVKYIFFDSNAGANAARNEGIRRSQGDVIFFLDSDDRFTNNKIKKILNIVKEEPDVCAGVFHSFDFVNNEDEVIQISRVDDAYVRLSDLKSGNPIGGFSNIAIRSAVFQNIGYLDEDMPSYQDYEFFLRLLEEYSLRGVDEVLTIKLGIIESDSEQRISGDLSKKINGQDLLLKKHSQKLGDNIISEFYYTRALLYMQQSAVSESRIAFNRAISLYPYNPLYFYHYIAALGGPRLFDISLKVKKLIKIKLFK